MREGDSSNVFSGSGNQMEPGLRTGEGDAALSSGTLAAAALRRFEQQLLQVGKLAAIGELTAGVAHEINNPLFAILGLVEFLVDEIEPGSKAHRRLLVIQETGLEIKEIVRALLEFSRESSEVRGRVSLAEVTRKTVDLARLTSSAKTLEFVERYAEDEPLVEANASQLEQVLLHLLTNAHEAMPDGGTVTVEVAGDGPWAVASVTDTGPGIAPAVLPRIFELFYTTKVDHGTGLGLAVSLAIAAAHGGTLTAETVPRGGARFVLRIPR